MKKSKAARIAKMLKAGESVTYIKRMLGVSESYIYFVKKQMLAEKAFTPKEVGVSDEVFVEAALAASQGKGKDKPTPKPEPEAEAKTVIQPSYDPEAGEYIVVEGAKSAQEVDAILNARGSNYGSFEGVAGFAQVMKGLIRDTQDGRGAYLPADQCEALDMISSKIARIVNGNADYVDSWIDIAGYATLVADRLQGKVR